MRSTWAARWIRGTRPRPARGRRRARPSGVGRRPEDQLRSDAFNMGGPVDTVYAPNAVSVSPVFRATEVNNALTPSDYTQLNGGMQNDLTAQQAEGQQRELTARAQGRPSDAVQANANTGQQNPMANNSATATQ